MPMIATNIVPGRSGYRLTQTQRTEIVRRYYEGIEVKAEMDQLSPRTLAEKFDLDYNVTKHMRRGYYSGHPDYPLIRECLEEYSRLRRIWQQNNIPAITRDMGTDRAVLLRVVDEYEQERLT